jgi:hypothetical protein
LGQRHKCILRAADKYGFLDLKIEAEKWHVKMTELTVDKVIGELLHADGNGNPLMKKVVMDFIVKNVDGVTASDSFQQLYESQRLASS